MKTKNLKVAAIEKKQFVCNDEWYGAIFECKNCSATSIMNWFRFCPECGIRLRFSKEAKEL